MRKTMSTWQARMKGRMKELKLTQGDVANKMGITRGAITHYLTGHRQPPLNQFSKLAVILKVEPAWLQFGPSSNEVNTPLELTSTATIAIEHKSLIPIFSWEQVSNLVGSNKIGNSEIQGYVPHFYTDKSSWYALRVKGDSMTSPRGHGKSFNEGDILIVDPEKTAVHGDFVVVVINGAKEATFKQYVIDGGIRYLKPLNPQYPIMQSNESNWICGIIAASIAGV
jgi:SOS-response transcriptional repressor LexA